MAWNDDLNAMQDVGVARQMQQKVREPKPKKKGNFLTGLIPTATSILGGVAGTVFAPGAGTAAGGAAGALLGTKLRNMITGEEDKASDYLGEAALGTLGGLGRGVKSTYGAIKAARGGEGANRARQVLQYGKQGADRRVADAARKTVTQPSGEAASILNAPTKPKFGQNASQEGFGLTVGQSAGRGRTLTPGSADETYNFITGGAQKYGGIRPGKPINQARDAQAVFNNVVGSLDDTLAQINRPLQGGEASTILSSAANKVSQNAAITGTTKTLGKFGDKINSAKSLDELESIRREADDLAFTQRGAGKTSAAAQAHAVRDAIDEFISPMSPAYKAIKGDYTVARDALEATSKANKNAKGFTVPLIQTEVGKQFIPGIKNRVSSKLSGGTPSASAALQQTAKPDPSALGAGVAMASSQLPIRALTSAGGEAPEPEAMQDTTSAPAASDILSGQQAPSQSSIYSRESAASDLQRDLMQTGGANMDKIMKLYEFLNPAPAAVSNKPMSAEASKVVSNAQAGLGALDILESQLQRDPSVQQKSAVSGTFNPFGVTSRALGTGQYENARQQAIDVIARIRTGAAVTKEEAQRFAVFLPQPGDDPETIQQKLGILRNQFETVVSRQPSYSESSAGDILAGAY
jgi:hypothetical protein